jgi:hypothetical protein
MENKMHLEIAGKGGRVMVASLPSQKLAIKPVSRTSSGVVSRTRLVGGVAPSIDPFKVTADELQTGDPELDVASVGAPLDDVMSAYYDPSAEVPMPIGHFQTTEVVSDVLGNEKERRPYQPKSRNLDTAMPIKIARRFPIDKALTMFVYKQVMQLVHEDSLTFDFLFGLAKDLHDTKEMALIGAGPKGAQPLVVRERGTPCRAFLFGEVSPDGQTYRLLMLLSDQELKVPDLAAAEAAVEAKKSEQKQAEKDAGAA